jgi:hypothetical protein
MSGMEGLLFIGKLFTMALNKDPKRILFLDNLRWLMVLLVVVLHSAVSYSNLAPWWCVKESNENSVFFDVVLLLLDVFLMPVLFFIAGYFAVSSFQRKGARHFLNRKLKRLGLPLVICIPLIGPSFAYIYHYTRDGFSYYMRFSEYWLRYLKSVGDFQMGVITSIDHFNHSHLWFMSLLLFFFVIFALFASKKKWHQASGLTVSLEQTSDRSILVILAAVGFISTISAFAANLIFSSPTDMDPWVIIANLLQFQPIKVVSYIVYFSMGVYAFHHKWFFPAQIPGHPAIWTLACALLSIGLLLTLKALMLNFSVGILFLYHFIRSFLCVSFLSAFTLWAVRSWNRPSPINEQLALNSYHIYIVHLLIVILLQLLLVGWSDGSVFVKFGIVSTASILISYGISQYAIRPYPRLSLTSIYVLFIILLVNIHPVGS